LWQTAGSLCGKGFLVPCLKLTELHPLLGTYTTHTHTHTHATQQIFWTILCLPLNTVLSQFISLQSASSRLTLTFNCPVQTTGQAHCNLLVVTTLIFIDHTIVSLNIPNFPLILWCSGK
jgi:hypothetical protein